METMLSGWLNEFEVEKHPVEIHRMDSLDNLTTDQVAAPFEVESTSSAQTCYERPKKQLKRASIASAKLSSTQDHFIAERKRREKFSQLFIALSAMVPGLKKMDKSSVLGDCIKFVEHLQARVKTLEEKTSKKTMESAVFINNFHVNSDAYLTGETSVDSSYQSLPEIQARICDDNVLIRIHCEKHKGIPAQTLLEIERLHLSVSSSSVLPFDGST